MKLTELRNKDLSLKTQTLTRMPLTNTPHLINSSGNDKIKLATRSFKSIKSTPLEAPHSRQTLKMIHTQAFSTKFR